MQIDLDARRAARAEREPNPRPHSTILGGRSFSLPGRCPLEALDLMAEGGFRAAFAKLLETPEDVVAFFAVDPPVDDADLEDLMSVYGTPGESSASPRSSKTTGTPPRPTSKPTTR
jgi:hypothetical protein